jgi:hypothetical protein
MLESLERNVRASHSPVHLEGVEPVGTRLTPATATAEPPSDSEVPPAHKAGRSRARAIDADVLEEELRQLKDRQAQLREEIRRRRNRSELGELEAKLAEQLAAVKRTVGEIRKIEPNWESRAFEGILVPGVRTLKSPAPRQAATVNRGSGRSRGAGRPEDDTI